MHQCQGDSAGATAAAHLAIPGGSSAAENLHPHSPKPTGHPCAGHELIAGHAESAVSERLQHPLLQVRSNLVLVDGTAIVRGIVSCHQSLSFAEAWCGMQTLDCCPACTVLADSCSYLALCQSLLRSAWLRRCSHQLQVTPCLHCCMQSDGSFL